MARPMAEPLRKAAILVSALDTASADRLLDQLSPEQAARVRQAVLSLKTIDPQEQERVLREFLRSTPRAAAQQRVDHAVELDASLAQRLNSTPQNVPSNAPSEAPTMDSSRPPSSLETPFRFLRDVAPQELFRVLSHHHPQIAAVVLAHLPPERASQVITYFPLSKQVDLLRRIAELEAAEPQVLRDLESELEGLFAGLLRDPRRTGIAAVRRILDATAKERRAELWEHLSATDHRLALQVESCQTHAQHETVATTSSSESGPAVADVPPAEPVGTDVVPDGDDTEAWSFDEVMALEDAQLASLFAEAEPTVVLLALAGAEPDFVARIQRCLPRRQARQLRRQLTQLQPLLLSDVEQAQRLLVLMARQRAQQSSELAEV
jgi:flagellar motor switch protein FliG